MTIERRPTTVSPPFIALIGFGLGVAIALADSRPGWDSTGITAGSILLAAALVAYLGRARPWLWALLVGLPTPAIEMAAGGSTGSLLALGFAGVGAVIGWALAHAG